MEGFLSMTCMKLNRKPSKPNPPTPCNCMITLNNNNKEKKAKDLYFLSKLFTFYTRCWSQTVRVFGRNLYISGRSVGGGRGVGLGNILLPFLYTRSRRKVLKRAVGRSSVILTSPS